MSRGRRSSLIREGASRPSLDPPREDFDAALTIAALAHEGITRKGTKIPYIVHPMAVAMILSAHGFAGEVVLAGLLHDVLEDMDWGDVSLQERFIETFPGGFGGRADHRADFRAFLAKKFGKRVLKLVEGVTERKRNARGEERSWKVRKKEALAHLAKARKNVVALKAADALHNVNSIVRDLQKHGIHMMRRFNAGPAETAWYYRKVAGIVQSKLGRANGLSAELVASEARLRSTLLQELGDAAKQIRGLQSR